MPKYVLWFPKSSAPTEVSKSYEVVNILKSQPVVFPVNFNYQSILSIAFVPCGIDRSEKVQKFPLFSHGRSSSNRSRIYSNIKHTAVLMSRF